MKGESRRAQKGYLNDKQKNMKKKRRKIPTLREKKNNNKYSRDNDKIEADLKYSCFFFLLTYVGHVWVFENPMKLNR
jgi:hypothetical protein